VRRFQQQKHLTGDLNRPADQTSTADNKRSVEEAVAAYGKIDALL
jgi:hypothetical protein